jgi:hypothetical protein
MPKKKFEGNRTEGVLTRGQKQRDKYDDIGNTRGKKEYIQEWEKRREQENSINNRIKEKK